MAKLLKSILGNDKKLSGVKSSSTEKLNLGGYTPKAGGEQKFVAKHSVEKFADRAGNGDDVYKGKTKEAPYQKQTAVAEDCMSDTEGLQAYSSKNEVPVSGPKPKKKKVTESVQEVLEHISQGEVIFKFKNGEKSLIEQADAKKMLSIFNSLTEENKEKFAEIAFNSPEDFYSISELKG